MGSTYQFRGKYFLCIQLLLFVLAFTSRLIGCEEHGDGVGITKSDYQSLVAIKKELVDSRGLLRSWGGSWSGACSGKWAGVKCVNGSVVAIQLPWRGLGGKISEKIGQLQALRKISLHDNALTGSIPWSIGNLRNLRGIYLFNNRLSGSIPGSIGNSPILQTVDVSNNSLTGVIPSNLWSSSRLYRLNMSFNSLIGPVPVNFTLKPSLTILALQNNNLSGPIPDSWGGGVLSGKGNISSQLQFLTLDQNHLSGTIPPSLTKLHLLRELSLSNNKISGPIPASLDHLANLSSFNVSYNNLSGIVPSDLSKKFDSSSFVGNLQLCGYNSSVMCVSPSPPAIVLPSPSSEHHKKLDTKDIILIAAGALLVVMLLLCCILCCCLIRRRASTKKKNGKATSRDIARKTEKSIPATVEVESGGEMGGKLVHFDGPFVFTADDLLCATAEIMGKSTYGTAYKATLEDGNQIAVKRLREKTTKGHREFEAEAATLGKIRHQNLLAMRAYYLGPKGEKLLVFDYMSNGSLSSFLHARGPESVISWPTRMYIAIGVARGVDYLHTEENMIHGNLTSSNVLLDEQTNPHIADFGISKLMTAAANTNVIATAGTLGYRAPELSKHKNANTKTDVYSLGVIILELLTGKSPGEPNNGMDLPQWVASIVKEEWTNEVFDLELMRDAPTISDELLNTLKLALHCVDPSPSARPEAVEVLKQLEEINPVMSPAPISADEEHKVATE